MIKSLLFSVALAAVCLNADAQVARLAPSVRKVAPADGAYAIPIWKVASLEGTDMWGYYTGNDLSDLDVVGVQNIATYSVGYFVPGDALLKGAKIHGMNVPFYSVTNMADVSVWITDDLDNEPLVSKEVDAKSLIGNSFNAIALDEPFAVPETGVYVGVTFTINKATSNGDKYPILCGGETAAKSLYMKIKIGTQEDSWTDYSSKGWGAYGMQLFVSDMNIPDANMYLRAKTVDVATIMPGGEVKLPVALYSSGKNAVNSIDYTVLINDSKETKHLDFATPIEGGFGKTGTAELVFNMPADYGRYTVRLCIDKVNGIDNALVSDTIDVPGKVLYSIVPRKTVVEEFTGTGCGWCPRGWAGMEKLKEKRENFIGIAFHQYNSSDAMYISNYYSRSKLGIGGAPGCSVDRKGLGVDPYYGDGEDIVETFDYYNSSSPEVAVTVSGEFSDYSVNAQAEVQYLIDSDKAYSIAYVLTADSLTGTTTAWRQSNYYASYSAASVGNDPYLVPFCSGGKYGSSSISGLVFGDVAIGSSYSKAGVNLAPSVAGEVVAGSKASTSYTIDLPTKVALRDAIKWNKVYIVALVVAPDGTIANAAKAQVTNWDEVIEIVAADIDGVRSDDAGAAEVARYNVNGQRIDAPQKGLNIVKLADGTIRKVMVK